jgi:hypothetical protein
MAIFDLCAEMCAGAVALEMALHRDRRGPQFFVGLAGLVTSV